jgi:hypothetical protein
MACCVTQYSDFAKAAPYFQNVILLAVQRGNAVYAHTVACTSGCGGRGVVQLVLKLRGDTNIYI